MEVDGRRIEIEGDPPRPTPSGGIIGLEFTDGRVLYCHRSTLANAGGYFAACFGDNGIPVAEQRKDDHGRSIFFLERDTDLFQLHNLPYIITKRPGKLPRYSTDPELWRVLRDEAVFFRLDYLSDLLHVTYSCSPDAGNDKGVLYFGWVLTKAPLIIKILKLVVPSM